jgi:tRNA threonylcarbamoyladenosine biosynthesis protein TsaE
MNKVYRIKTETEMMNLGAELSKICGDSCVIYLTGVLGAGKTVLVRGFLQALGHKGLVTSPTFTLVEPYQLNGKQIYHFDLCRVTDPQELENIGIRDYFAEPAIFLIEWPENGKNKLPKPDITCDIKMIDHNREVCITILKLDN